MKRSSHVHNTVIRARRTAQAVQEMYRRIKDPDLPDDSTNELAFAVLDLCEALEQLAEQVHDLGGD